MAPALSRFSSPADQSSMASRVIGSSLKKDQLGAQVRLYINTVCAA